MSEKKELAVKILEEIVYDGGIRDLLFVDNKHTDDQIIDAAKWAILQIDKKRVK